MTNDYGNWPLVFILAAFFLVFLKGIFKPRTKVDWVTYKSFGAFLVALFAEMYGFPLTIYILTAIFGTQLSFLNLSHNSGHLLAGLLGVTGDPHLSWIHMLSDVLVGGGFILVARSWRVLYEARKKKSLALDGPYRIVRHPQYTGFMLIILGFLLQWPTIITLVMAPILIGRYVKLARTEEKEMLKKDKRGYSQYMLKTPSFFPTPFTFGSLANSRWPLI